MTAASRCAFTTAAGVRCCLADGHTAAHDTVYIFDALPERPEQLAEPLPEDLERLLRDPNISVPQDEAVHEVIVADLRKHPEREAVPVGAYLNLWALYKRTVRDAPE